ncbi:MAG: 4Fe-4S binding protein [Ignisphaera sp.]
MTRLTMLKEVLKSLFSKPSTEPLAEVEKGVFSPYSRGCPVLIPEKCTGCSLCAMNCPSNAITMKIVGEKNVGGKTLPVRRPEFNYFKCIYCGLCAQVCQFNAIEMRRDLVILRPRSKC